MSDPRERRGNSESTCSYFSRINMLLMLVHEANSSLATALFRRLAVSASLFRIKLKNPECGKFISNQKYLQSIRKCCMQVSGVCFGMFYVFSSAKKREKVDTSDIFFTSPDTYPPEGILYKFKNQRARPLWENCSYNFLFRPFSVVLSTANTNLLKTMRAKMGLIPSGFLTQQ